MGEKLGFSALHIPAGSFEEKMIFVGSDQIKGMKMRLASSPDKQHAVRSRVSTYGATRFITSSIVGTLVAS